MACPTPSSPWSRCGSSWPFCCVSLVSAGMLYAFGASELAAYMSGVRRDLIWACAFAISPA